MLRYATLLVFIALLPGCSSAPDLIDSDQFATFTPGKTNETEVIGALGKPLETVAEADGTRIDQYAFGGTAKGPDSIWPSWLGGASMPSFDMVDFSFNANGVLTGIGGAAAGAAK